MSHGPQRDAYDVVVIGSGLGGLTAAALLAHAGQSVLVAEAQSGPGGYAHAFTRGGCVFNPAGHIVGDKAVFDSLLRHLGVRERCTLLPIDRFYTAVLPGFRLEAPCGAEAYAEAHAEHFPEHADAIRSFVDTCVRVHREAHELPPSMPLKELDRLVATYPTVFRYRSATLAEVLAEVVPDERVRAVLAAPWTWLGLPPSRLSFFLYAQFLCSYMLGAFTVEGSFQRLVDALVAALEDRGGELVVDGRVGQVVVEDGAVAGVVLEGGRHVAAPVVVSNGDATQTLEELVGLDHFPEAFRRRFRRLRPAISAFLLLAATSLDLSRSDPAHLVLLRESWDDEEVFANVLRGRPWSNIMALTTLLDKTLAPAGEHLVMGTAIAPYDVGVPWGECKDEFAGAMLDQLEGMFPGFRDGLTFEEAATPVAMERYSLNRAGAIYGWEMAQDQTGSRRPPQETALPGLYLAGHWTNPGGGVLRSCVSGVQTAALVLARAGIRDAIPALGAAPSAT